MRLANLGAIHQRAPELIVQETVPYRDEKGRKKTKTISHQLVPDSSNIAVNLNYDPRRKGLLWYRTYAVEFDGTYTVTHTYSRQPYLIVIFHFPSQQALYDDFSFTVNDKEASLVQANHGTIKKSIPLPAGEKAKIHVHYKSRGLNSWTYSFGEGVSQVKNFTLVAKTDFNNFDFPPRSISPTTKRQLPKGWELTWKFTNLLSGFQVGVEVPEELNAGPVAARISYFGPVGLLFFISVVVIIGIMRGQNLHPMHYFFICAGFFAFHILIAYTADHVDFKLAFLVSALVSLLLVTSYLIRAVGAQFALLIAAPAQLLFLVLFSYAFFFKGYTGLTITIGSIITLAVLMHLTAKVNWWARFGA